MLYATTLKLMACAIGFSAFTLTAQAQGLPEVPAKPKNIIIMIGDGMGPAYTSAYRLYKDDPDTEEVEETVFNRLLVGSASTFPARESGYITDSAAAATALSSGIKTYNGAIGVDLKHQPVPTLLERAHRAGLATGVTVTSQVNHATPAAFLSHNISRKHYDELAQSYLDTGASVILGGGQRYFPLACVNNLPSRIIKSSPTWRHLIISTKAKYWGYLLMCNCRGQLMNLKKTDLVN